MKIYIYAIFLITSIIPPSSTYFSPPALVEVRSRASLYSHPRACGGARSRHPIFSPPALVGGVRGRASELAGGAIICKDKPPPASAKALAPPPEAEGEMIDEPALYSHPRACGGAKSRQPIFSPPALVGGVRGRDSELAGGAIICKDKPPPASAKALAPPPEAGGEMIDEPSLYSHPPHLWGGARSRQRTRGGCDNM